MYPTRPLFIFSKTARTPHHIFNPGATRNLYGFRLPIVTHIPFTYYQHFLFFAQYTLSSIHNGNTGYSTVIVRNGTGTCPCPTPKETSTTKNLADTIERKRAVQFPLPLLQLTSVNKVPPVSVLRLLRVAARRLQNQLLRKGVSTQNRSKVNSNGSMSSTSYGPSTHGITSIQKPWVSHMSKSSTS